MYSVSSIFRPDQVFFRWYGREYAHVLRCVTRFFVQNEESKRLLEDLGLKDVMVVGDTRFDRVLQIKEAAKQLPIAEAFSRGHKVFVAGSSWPPDEDVFIEYFNEHRDWRLIIAPHVIGEDHLRQILSKLKMSSVLYTQTTPEEASKADYLIINCFGLLSSIYQYGQVAYVGGGFGVGIHNVLEAAVWGMPVIFGPNNKNFQEAQGLLAAGGGFEIATDDNFAQLMDRLSSDSKFLEESSTVASTFVQGQVGATEKVLGEVGLL